MGCLFSRNEPKIKIFDLTTPCDDFEYLRPQGTITLSIYRKYNVPPIDIRFNGWYEISVRLCILNRENIYFLKELLYRHLVGRFFVSEDEFELRINEIALQLWKIQYFAKFVNDNHHKVKEKHLISGDGIVFAIFYLYLKIEFVDLKDASHSVP